MAREGNQQPKDSGGNVIAPLFIQKRQLNEEQKEEMYEELKRVREEIRAVEEMWEVMSTIFNRREEISIARKEAHLLQAKEKQVDYFTITPAKTRHAEATSGSDADHDGATDKRYYKMWSDELKKKVEQQRQKTRQCAEKWFKYLQKFDDSEKHYVPPSYNPPSWQFLWFGLVIVLCAIYTLLSFGLEGTKICEGEPLACLHEMISNFLSGFYNSYLAFHNITNDYIEATGTTSESRITV